MLCGNPRTGRDGTSVTTLLGLPGGVAPHILGNDREAERLAGEREGGPDCLPMGCRPRHQRKGRLLRQLGEFVGREGVDRGLELDALFAIGLQPKAGRTLPAVAHSHGESVAGAQIAAADANKQGVGPRPDVESVEPDFEHGAIARLDRGEIRRGRPVELRLAHVRGGPPRDFHHAGVVDAERASGIGQCELGVRACHERPRRRELDRAHLLGEISRERHDRKWTSIAARLLAGREKAR